MNGGVFKGVVLLDILALNIDREICTTWGAIHVDVWIRSAERRRGTVGFLASGAEKLSVGDRTVGEGRRYVG